MLHRLPGILSVSFVPYRTGSFNFISLPVLTQHRDMCCMDGEPDFDLCFNALSLALIWMLNVGVERWELIQFFSSFFLFLFLPSFLLPFLPSSSVCSLCSFGFVFRCCGFAYCACFVALTSCASAWSVRSTVSLNVVSVQESPSILSFFCPRIRVPVNAFYLSAFFLLSQDLRR